MKCANPVCNTALIYWRGGVLRLLEMEAAPGTRLHGQGDGFPVCRSSARHFWLCSECARVLAIKRWTLQGLILERRPTPHDLQLQTQKLQPTPAVERSSVMHSLLAIVRTA
jgi:hypothetical protein